MAESDTFNPEPDPGRKNTIIRISKTLIISVYFTQKMHYMVLFIFFNENNMQVKGTVYTKSETN